MPRKQKKQKRLVPQISDDPVVRNNLELIQNNFDEIFRRLDRRRWAVSEESTAGYSLTGTTAFTPVPTLKVSLDCTGKNPVLVFMRQKSEFTTGTTISGGGIGIVNSTVPGGRVFFYLGSATRRSTIHVVPLGGGISTVSNPISWLIDYPASAVLAFDENVVAGVNTWEVGIALKEASTTVYIADCDLVAVELF